MGNRVKQEKTVPGSTQLQALRESEERFRLIFENSPVGNSMTGIDGSIMVNKAFCDILGYNTNELKNKKWMEITHPDDIKESQKIVNLLLDGKKQNIRYEKRYIHKKGNIVFTDVSTTLQRDISGNPLFFITAIIDITKVKKASEEVKISEERYRSYIKMTGQIAWVTNAAGEVVEDIPHFRDFTGLTYNEVKGSGWVSSLHPDDVAPTMKIWNEAVLVKSKYETEYRVKRFDGIYRHLLAKGSPVFEENGEIKEWVGVCIDISERKENEEALRESREKYFYLYANSPVGMYHTKIDGSKVLEINDSACKMMGFTKEELIGKPSSLRWADPNRRSEIIKMLYEFGVANNFDAEILKKDGTKLSCLLSMKVFKDKDYIEGFIIDISDRKLAEEALKEAKKNLEVKVKVRTAELEVSKRLLEETGRLARVGGWEIDLKTNKLSWSEMTLQIHEVEPGFVPELETAIDFYAPESIPVISQCVDRAIKFGDPFDVELELITAKKNRLWVRAIGEAYYENGEIIKVGGVFQDINARKLIEEELIKHRDHLKEMVNERTRELDNAIADLKRSNQELEQFAYVASHDLQEPLRMVSSYTQLLERRYKDQLDQDAKDFIFFAVDGANRMQRLINDLLDYSRVTTKGKPFLKLDLSAILGQAIVNLQKRIQETGAMIVNDDLPFVYGDEVQLIRVFQNLLDNAMKFIGKDTPRINVTASTVDEKVRIAITDNGIGIDKIYTERVFTIFQRLHNKIDYPGTGIGLAICKRTVERHGGKIWFESEPGNGTTFFFTLNYK
jgi:PAS domain S-box-containing protein